MTPQEFADWAAHIAIAGLVLGPVIAAGAAGVMAICEWWRDFKRAKGGER